MGKKLTDEAVLNEMVGLLGVKRAVTLLGWSAAFVALGCSNRHELLNAPLGGRATRYRVVADLETVRRVLIERGYDMDDEVATSPTGILGSARAMA